MRNMFKYLVYIKIYHILYYNIRDNKYNILKNDPQQDALRRRVYKTAVRLFITIICYNQYILNRTSRSLYLWIFSLWTLQELNL